MTLLGAYALTIRAGNMVSMAGGAYSPGAISINVGDQVRWLNDDTRMHSATDLGGAFHSGVIQTGNSYVRTFTAPGTYGYYCVFHGELGTITVGGG